ncbi:TIGR03089 family protein [Brachybacterium vulturis]|uniref:TIGR03089 family protein n=1 Tax=Brachybacterium vulturis TaxID=2017484 RepID=UPI003736E633
MSTSAAPSPQTAAQLLRALEQTGARPALAWYGEAARIELSGHVLANWMIKSIGHLHDEIDLAPGDEVVLDLPPHWKRLALALASWALGAAVTVLEREAEPSGEVPPAPEQPRVVVTDRPDSSLADSADEVLALDAVSLAPRFSAELPPLAHDWLAEVRGSSDRLGVALPAWSGPAPRPDAPASSDPAAPPRLLVDGDGLRALPPVLAALIAGGGIVGPSAMVTERQAQEEAVTARG